MVAQPSRVWPEGGCTPCGGPGEGCDVVQQEKQRGVYTRFRANETLEPQSQRRSRTQSPAVRGSVRGSVRVTPRTR